MRLDVDERLSAVVRQLVDAGRLAPVALGTAEEELFADCDLASLAENRLGNPTDPRSIDEARRAEWRARALDEELLSPSARRYQRCLWLLDEGERAGTIAIATTTMGGSFVHVASVYVLPDRRGRAIARSSLTALRDALGAHGLGLRLDTSWCWQRAASLYLRMGMWVHMWKRELSFRWSAREPEHVVDIGEERASFSIRADGGRRLLFEASRSHDRLVLEWAGDDRDEHLRWDACSTFSLALALKGWPLIRSLEEWGACRGSDLGPPEALADRIAWWEAWHRHRGWRVETPRIPGLEYPTWAEREASW